MDRDLACFRLENSACNADDISDIQLFEFLIGLLADAVPCNIGLDISLQILDITEGCLAHHAFGHHTARDGDFLSFHLLKMLFGIRAVRGYVKFCNLKRILSTALKLGQLFPADLQQLI